MANVVVSVIGTGILYWLVYNATESVMASVLILASIFLHELGHIIVLWAYRIPIRSFTVFGIGMAVRINMEAYDKASSSARAVTAIAGPFVNMALAVIFIQLDGGIWRVVALGNIGLVAFNMLPLPPFDGGKVYRELFRSTRYGLGTLMFLMVPILFVGLNCTPEASMIRLLFGPLPVIVLYLLYSHEKHAAVYQSEATPMPAALTAGLAVLSIVLASGSVMWLSMLYS